MISILVVDDTHKKVVKISKVLQEKCNIDVDNITIVPDIISAKKILSCRNFDILLLDIQVPMRFDQTPKLNGGVEFLEELQRNDRYFLPTFIIGITAFEKEYKEYKDNFFSIIQYQEDSFNWEDQLGKLVNYVSDNKKVADRPSDTSYDYDIAIICALGNPELASIKDLSNDWNLLYDEMDSTVYYTTIFKEGEKELRVVAAAAEQMGMTATAVLSMKLIQKFKPYYLIMTGIAAGVEGTANLGDVLVADPTWDYNSGKIKEENGQQVFYPDPLPIRLDLNLRSQMKLLSEDSETLRNIRKAWVKDRPDTKLHIHIGPMGTGSAVLSHSAVVKSIQSHVRKLIGIDMEAYAVFYAAENCNGPKPKAISMKSVCDFADAKKADAFQAYASYTSAQVFYKFAMNYLDFSRKSNGL